jgi:von Willebrand factor type A domain
MQEGGVRLRLAATGAVLGLVVVSVWASAGPAAQNDTPTGANSGAATDTDKPAGASSLPAKKSAAKPSPKAGGKSAAAKPEATAAEAKQSAVKEEAAEFRAARPEIQRGLRSKSADARVAAMRQLQGYPLVDAAKLAMATGFDDESEQVRGAAYETLLRFSANQEICDYFLDLLGRQVRKNELSEKSVPMLAALLASTLPEVDLSTRDLIDSSLDKSRKGELLVTELADQLGARPAEDSVTLLVKISKTDMFANHFGVRRAVVDALVRLDRLSAVGELIHFLVDVQGEARADILKYLTAITGQNFLNDSKAWASWWRQHQETFVLPPPGARAVMQVAAADTPYYYGLPIYAQKLVFVLDTSGSMSQFNRLETAKRELSNAIRNLNEDSQFAIIVFNGIVDVWQRKLMVANEVHKKTAITFVQSQAAHADTASYDALEAAFAFDAEAIFFLSDGAPTSGKIVAPGDIINTITTGNRSRRESIYAIGLAPGPADSPMEWFMKTLAEQNSGVYRRVDE